VTHDEQTELGAQSEQNESIFLVRVVRVGEQEGSLIGEDCGSLWKRYPMLSRIAAALDLVPFDPHASHE
jgi:hypothetical protein